MSTPTGIVATPLTFFKYSFHCFIENSLEDICLIGPRSPILHTRTYSSSIFLGLRKNWDLGKANQNTLQQQQDTSHPCSCPPSSPRSLPGRVERWYPFSCSDSLPSLPFILFLTILLAWPKHNHSSRPSLISMFSEALLDKGSPHLFLITSYYCVIGSYSSLSLSLSLSFSLWLANQLPKDRNIIYTHAYLMTIIIKLFRVPLVFWLKNMKGRMWRRPDEERQVIIMTTLPLGGRWCYLEIVWVHSNPSAIERTIFFPSIPSQKQYGHLRDP